MSERKISSTIVGRQVVEAIKPVEEDPARLKGTIVGRHAEEPVPESMPERTKPALSEETIRSLISDLVTEKISELEADYSKKIKKIEEAYQARIREIEKVLKSKLDEQAVALDHQKPVVNVTVENRLRVTKTVVRDDRGLIEQIIEETVPLDGRTSS